MAKTKNNGIVEVKIRAPKVNVDNKREIDLTLSTKSSLSDEEIKKIIELLVVENCEMKKKYFSYNTPIIKTRQRRFISLVKLFVERCSDRILWHKALK